jgi:hypothetical protein
MYKVMMGDKHFFIFCGLVLFCFITACAGEKKKANQQKKQGSLWRNSTGKLVNETDLIYISSDIQSLSHDFNHLVLPLSYQESPCGSSWITEDCVPWGTLNLFRCSQDWLNSLQEEVWIEGKVIGKTTKQIIVIDANGMQHKLSLNESGEFKIKLKEGIEPVLRIQLEPVEGQLEILPLLWLHIFGINFKSNGMVLKRSESIWFITAIEEGGPAERAGLELGDKIVSMNRQSLEGADSSALSRALQLEPEQTIVEYARCEITGSVTMPRVPRAVFWSKEQECPCPSQRCSPTKVPKEKKEAKAPRDCTE